MDRLYIVYDERAMYDVDRAMVQVTADTLNEAKEYAEDFAPCVIYSYKKEGELLTEPRFEEYIR